VTVDLNSHIEDPVSTKAVRPEPHKTSIHGSVAISKPLIIENDDKQMA